MYSREAIDVLKRYRPYGRQELPGELFGVISAVIKESMVQKPPHNSNYATALEVYQEYVSEGYGVVITSPFISWLRKRLNADKQHCA